MGRAPCCEKIGLKRGRWTGEEDEKLRKYIEANGEGSWRSLPKNAGLLRCGKSCRLRWINYLRSDLKRGNISAAEEEIIINLHASLGNRWSLIAAHLPGRTDNEIKNYWNSHLSRRFHGIRRPNPDFIPPPPPKPQTHGGGRKKNKKTDRVSISKPPKEPEHQAGEANAAVFMPTTPTPERESLSSSTQRPEITGDGIVPTESPTEERECRVAVDGVCDLDDIVDDLSEIWGPEFGGTEEFVPGKGFSETGSGLESLMSSSLGDSRKWEPPEMHENEFSWILDDDGDDDKWAAEHGKMDEEKHDAMLSWLLS